MVAQTTLEKKQLSPEVRQERLSQDVAHGAYLIGQVKRHLWG